MAKFLKGDVDTGAPEGLKPWLGQILKLIKLREILNVK